MTASLTLRALAALPEDQQEQIRRHQLRYGRVDALDDLIGWVVVAHLSGKTDPFGFARGALRREQNAKWRAASRFNIGLDALPDQGGDGDDNPTPTPPSPRKRKEWVKHIAESRGVSARRAQQIVKRALELDGAPGELFAGV